ncbi:MAG: apolipoprotein N-acyltransferase [Actinobacteria bacterium]|nr:apolipoprotein N-acyltransferase [Actinomycetota bacterium]
MSRYVNYLLAALSGILLALSFPYPSIGILAWVGIIPLLFAIKRSDFKITPVLGLVSGVIFFSILLYWILIFGFMAWVALSLFLSLSFILFTSGAWVAMQAYRSTAQLLIIPSLWATCEYIRSLGPLGFAWGNIGSAVNNPYLLWIASYTGEIGLGFVIVLVNLVLFQILGTGDMRERMRFAVTGILVLMLAVVVWPAIGMLVHDLGKGSSKVINVALVQPNIEQRVKLDTSNNGLIKARYLVMTREALRSKPNLVIWPENIFVSFMSDEKKFIEETKRILNPTKTSLVFGGIDDIEGNIYNNAFYLNQEGTLQSYRKIHLVPFGEYVPVRGLVEQLNSMAKLVIDYTPGDDYKVFDTHHNGTFSTVICFESSDSRLVRRMVRNGARMLIVITNDGWFGKTAAAEQHFQISRMRAVEYGIPVIQAANTGISGIVSRSGEVKARTKLNEKRVLYGSIAFASEPSFFARFGYMMPYFYVIIILAAILYKALRKRARA